MQVNAPSCRFSVCRLQNAISMRFCVFPSLERNSRCNERCYNEGYFLCTKCMWKLLVREAGINQRIVDSRLNETRYYYRSKFLSKKFDSIGSNSKSIYTSAESFYLVSFSFSFFKNRNDRHRFTKQTSKKMYNNDLESSLCIFVLQKRTTRTRFTGRFEACGLLLMFLSRGPKRTRHCKILWQLIVSDNVRAQRTSKIYSGDLPRVIVSQHESRSRGSTEGEKAETHLHSLVV